jgi:hypothetical protein
MSRLPNAVRERVSIRAIMTVPPVLVLRLRTQKKNDTLVFQIRRNYGNSELSVQPVTR